MTIDEMIAVLQAAKEGKTIQCFVNGKWTDTGRWPFNIFHRNSYRVKPEPKVAWLNEYHEGAPDAYLSRDEAFEARDAACTRVAVKYVEAQ